LDTGRTGEESVADGLADYLEETPVGLKAPRLPVPNRHSRSFRSASFLSVMAMPLSERRAGVLILPRFSLSHVISVNLMTFQTRGIGNTSRKLAGAPLGGVIDTVVSSVCDGIDKHLSSSGDFHVTR
jgi:hypothetical protein